MNFWRQAIFTRYSDLIRVRAWAAKRNRQCSGSMTFWCGSRSGDPCLCLMDPDPEPAICVIDLHDSNKKRIKIFFFCLLPFEGPFTSFFKDRKSKISQKKVRIKVFLTWSCLMIEGSGSIPLTHGSGSGSGRPKNMWTPVYPDPDSEHWKSHPWKSCIPHTTLPIPTPK